MMRAACLLIDSISAKQKLLKDRPSVRIERQLDS